MAMTAGSDCGSLMSNPAARSRRRARTSRPPAVGRPSSSDRGSGVRAGIAYLTRSNWEIAFGYTYFHTSGSAFSMEPPGGNLWATRSHPDRNEEAREAAAEAGVDDVTDIAVVRAIALRLFTRVLGGNPFLVCH